MPIQLKNTPPYYRFTDSTGLNEEVLSGLVDPLISSGGSIPDVLTILIPANTLVQKGDVLKIYMTITTTGADVKSINATIGTSGELTASTGLTTAGSYSVSIMLMRNTETTFEKRSESWRGTSGYAVSNSGGSANWSIDQNLSISITSVDVASIDMHMLQVKKENL